MPQYTIATWARFVHKFDSFIFFAQRVQQPINRLGAVWDVPEETYIALSAGVRNGNRDSVLVNVKPNVRIEVVHDRPPFEAMVIAAQAIRCSVTYCGNTSAAEDGHTIYDIHVALSSPIALEALERIGRLYNFEEEIRGRPPHERHTVRQARAGPELKSLHEWLHKTATGLSKKSELAKAIRYALSNWVALTRYCEDGRLEIDNNAAERALRAVALGRKNWLFAGSDDGGERAAAIYTLLGTAKLNDLNPESYLRYVLERIADHPINQIEELLPWNLLDKMPELRIAA